MATIDLGNFNNWLRQEVRRFQPGTVPSDTSSPTTRSPSLSGYGPVDPQDDFLVSYILAGQQDAATILLNKGADPTQRTVFGMDAAIAAAARAYAKTLGKSIVPGDIDTDDGSRPIHFAAASGSTTCVRVLHEQKANLTAPMEDGSTALHIAVRYNHTRVVKELLKKAPDLRMMSDNMGFTPYMNALQDGSPHIINIFTDCQIIPSKSRNALVGEMIDKVIRFGDPVLCSSLLSEINGVDFEACPLLCSCTPVMLALHEKKPAVIKLFLEWGFNIFHGKCSTHFDKGVDTLNNVCQDPELSELIDSLLSSYLEGIDWTAAPVSPVHAAAKAGNHNAIKSILQHIREREDEYRCAPLVSWPDTS